MVLRYMITITMIPNPAKDAISDQKSATAAPASGTSDRNSNTPSTSASPAPTTTELVKQDCDGDEAVRGFCLGGLPEAIINKKQCGSLHIEPIAGDTEYYSYAQLRCRTGDKRTDGSDETLDLMVGPAGKDKSQFFTVFELEYTVCVNAVTTLAADSSFGAQLRNRYGNPSESGDKYFHKSLKGGGKLFVDPGDSMAVCRGPNVRGYTFKLENQDLQVSIGRFVEARKKGIGAQAPAPKF